MIGKYLSLKRASAPLPKRHSSVTTPRSLSISEGSKLTWCAQSSKTCMAFLYTMGLSVGTCSSYTVSSKLVYAFKSAPKFTPLFSRKSTSSCFLKFLVPLKHMCSTKCARPLCLSVSKVEPAFTTSLNSALFFGSTFFLM